jgi:diketogulonate reductase-like aldo/keto reductase
VSSIIVGATKPEQLQESLGSLEFTLEPALIARLDAVSEPARPFPYYMFADGHQARIHGQVEVTDKPAAFDRPVRVPAPRPAAS